VYPSHRLTRIRAILRWLPAACEIDAEILSAEAFTGLQPTPELEQKLADFAAAFSIPATEQSELEDLSRTLTENVERTIGETGRLRGPTSYSWRRWFTPSRRSRIPCPVRQTTSVCIERVRCRGRRGGLGKK
jgi:hypothetical protein